MTTIAWKSNVLAADGVATRGECLVKTDRRKIVQLDDGWFCGLAGIPGLAHRVAREAISRIDAGDSIEEFGRAKLDPQDDCDVIIARGPHAWIVGMRGTSAIHEYDYRCWAIGTGWQFAIGAMLAGASARVAVSIASNVDPYSGGTPSWIDFNHETPEIVTARPGEKITPLPPGST